MEMIILIPLQIASTVGETVAHVLSLGLRGLALANARRFTAQGQAILETYKSFTGDSVLEEVSRPWNGIGDKIGMLICGILQWTRTHVRQNLILGDMTKEEFTAGKISIERLVRIELAAGPGRWVDLPGGVKGVLTILLMGGVTIISSRISGFAISELVVLALAIAPLARLQVDLHEHQHNPNSGSIVFNTYIGLFRLYSIILGIALMVALYYYSRENGFGTTVNYFLITSIIQGPFYVLLKFILPGEILSIPLGTIGIVLLYFFVVL